MKKLLITFFLLASIGCADIYARTETSTEDRLRNFPTSNLDTKGKLSILWDEHMIPFVEAEKDEDVPFALGLIQAHLRIGQLELMRHLSQGRVSEMVGPFGIDIDHSIRILNFGKATKQTIAAMPPETKLWATRFLAGMNAYINNNPDLVPSDLKILGITRLEPWSLEELVTAWKLAAVDVNWMVYFSFLQSIDKSGVDQAWKKLLDVGAQSVPSFSNDNSPLGQALFSYTKSGSNSIVIGKSKSESGHALIANDPHLGLTIPNFWMIAGFRSPSYRAIGLMIPSFPAIAIGRNSGIAWGGTNMWGLSSNLFALSEEELATAETRIETIKVRDWFDKKVTVRTTKWGPVISDSPFFKGKIKPTTLRWVGHDVSDELTAFLKANRAQSVKEFRDAFETYAVSAQNLLVADRDGNIGHVLAIRHPIRPDPNNKSLRQPTSNSWTGFDKPTDLPFAYNPPSGYIASANNIPFGDISDLGWLYRSNDRILRWKQLADQNSEIDIYTLMNWQMDTFSESSLKICTELIHKVEMIQDEVIQKSKVWISLKKWDGYYRANSNGAVAFETLMTGLLKSILSKTYSDDDVIALLTRSPSWKTIALEEISKIDAKELAALVRDNIPAANEQFAKYPTWADMHRVEASHLLSNIPIIGSRYRYMEFGSGGGSDTIFKTATPMTGEIATSSYGTNARHISDLADIDENYFVLFGGQDGWLTSPQTLDQVLLWKKGDYIWLPLSDEKIPLVFKLVLQIKRAEDRQN